MGSPCLRLKPHREKSLLRRHPWVFSGALDEVLGDPAPGQTVDVLSWEGKWLARAAFSPHSQITARVWTWEEGEAIDPDFFRRRIEASAAGRSGLRSSTDAMRLVNAESDGLPGLVVDRYGRFLVAQFLSAGPERWKEEILTALRSLEGVSGIYERSDVEVREKEDLTRASGVLWGENPPDLIEIREGPWRFLVDIIHGQKTGFYLDQRESRLEIHRLLGAWFRGASVLNAFSFTGAFAVAALTGGAGRVTNVDSSAPALDLARKNLILNSLSVGNDDFTEGDVFRILRGYRDSGASFDVVILDPPKLAASRSQVERASRAYKDLNWLAFRLVRPGGCVVTFSCSGSVNEDLFQKIVFGASLDAAREVQVLGHLRQASDHPVRLSFPEGTYLKGLICRVEP
jgi:23S rRNA (cytosine1962-C5)-methyltransferase